MPEIPEYPEIPDYDGTLKDHEERLQFLESQPDVANRNKNREDD
jgi:hypothetical protein